MRTGLVIIASTRAAAGVYEDRSGPIAVEFLRSHGLEVPDALVVADSDIAATLDRVLSAPQRPSIILTSGGTGLSADDCTVESVEKHLERTLTGIVYAFFARSSVPTAILSRAVAGTVGSTFIMTLPGSRGGVRDGCAVLDPILNHLLAQLEGSHEH